MARHWANGGKALSCFEVHVVIGRPDGEDQARLHRREGSLLQFDTSAVELEQWDALRCNLSYGFEAPWVGSRPPSGRGEMPSLLLTLNYLHTTGISYILWSLAVILWLALISLNGIAIHVNAVYVVDHAPDIALCHRLSPPYLRTFIFESTTEGHMFKTEAREPLSQPVTTPLYDTYDPVRTDTNCKTGG
ncbi:hypothetical protein F5Y01DRAFT_312479 [Xylaria sp. FL0043]|nr:hypothetical protein F5Y01DRAFT_312479 [Xylaria sp. FL0043]